MGLVISDRVKETTLTGGVGTLTLAGAFGGFRTFSEAIGDGNTTYYVIENEAQYEIGIGTYSSTGNSLSRDTILQSSEEDNTKITLSGLSVVFCAIPADRLVYEKENDDFHVDSYMIATSGAALENDVGISGLLTLRRTDAGNFFHAYVDDANDNTISLYHDATSSPDWKLGLKGSPNTPTEAPTYAYIYASDGTIGLYSNSLNSINLTHGGGFNVRHKGNTVLSLIAIRAFLSHLAPLPNLR